MHRTENNIIQAIYNRLSQTEPTTVKEAAEASGAKLTTAKRILTRMISTGVAAQGPVKKRPGPGRPEFTYFKTDKVVTPEELGL